jgi:hypothetical protein
MNSRLHCGNIIVCDDVACFRSVQVEGQDEK